MVTKIYNFCNVDAGKYNFSLKLSTVGSTVTSCVYGAAPFVIRFQNREQVLPSSVRLCNILCIQSRSYLIFVSYQTCKIIGLRSNRSKPEKKS